MTVRIVVAVALAAIAVLVAFLLERRRRAANVPVRDAYPTPRQLYRGDFPLPDAPLLLALFSSSTCDSCAKVREIVLALDDEDVAACDLEFPAQRDLHERYAISGVPMVLIADAEGVVRESFVGPVNASDLESALARARS
jgi:hypothetical protein